GLNEPIKSDMQNKGFEGCKGILSFMRYVREKHDIGLEEFVKEQMGENDYQKFTQLHSKLPYCTGVLFQTALKTIINPNTTKIINRKHPKFIDFKKSPSLAFTSGLILRNG